MYRSESHDFGTIRFVSMWRIEWYQTYMILIDGSQDITIYYNIFMRYNIYIYFKHYLNGNILWPTDRNCTILVPIDSSHWDESIGTKIMQFRSVDHKIQVVRHNW